MVDSCYKSLRFFFAQKKRSLKTISGQEANPQMEKRKSGMILLIMKKSQTTTWDGAETL